MVKHKNQEKDKPGDAGNARPIKQHNLHHPSWCYMLVCFHFETKICIHAHADACARIPFKVGLVGEGSGNLTFLWFGVCDRELLTLKFFFSKKIKAPHVKNATMVT